MPARLRRRLARRGPPDPQRRSTSPRDLEPADEPKPNDTPLRRLLPALAERGFEGGGRGDRAPRAAGRRRSDAGCRDAPAADPGQRARAPSGRPSSCARSPPRPRTIRWRRRAAPPPLLDPSPRAGAGRPPLLLGAGAVRALRLPLLRRAGARRARRRRRRGPSDEARRARRRSRRPSSSSRGVDRATLALRARQRGARGARVERAARLGAADGRAARRLLAPRGADGQRRGARRARERLVAGWLGIDLRRSLEPDRGCAPRSRSCSTSAGPSLRGQIDLLADRRRTACRPWSTTRPTRSTAARAAELGARYAAQRAGLRARGRRRARAPATAHVFLEAPGEPVIEEFDAAAPGRGARAARGRGRADARRRLRAHRRALPGALLRLPGGGPALPEPKWQPRERADRTKPAAPPLRRLP